MVTYNKSDVDKKIKNLDYLIESYTQQIKDFQIQKLGLLALLDNYKRDEEYTQFMRIEEEKRMKLEDD